MEFRLRLFGTAGIDGPEGPVTGRAVQRRRLALLALLAVARERGVTREKLLGYLWPDTDPERARNQLSDSVYRINQAIGSDAIIPSGDSLRLNPERLPCDVWEFADAIDAVAWQRAAELHPAPFLDGFFLTDCHELERWADAQRERFTRSYGRAVEALADAAEEQGAEASAVRWWRLLAALDPYSSRVAVRLMRALQRTGDGAAALQHGLVHTEQLANDIGVAPDAELTALIAELRGPADLPEPATGHGRSVAVLPFINLSGDPDNDYFADGITEDIIAHLARIDDLRVISRTSVMRFRDRDRSLRQIGAVLGAGVLLDGSVRRDGDRVRIVVQLIDAATDRHLWAETYDRMLTDVFAIQTDIALRIADALRARLSAEEKSHIWRTPTRNVQAYQLYLKGRHCLVRYTDEGARQATEFFQRAVEADPGYALAHTGIAMAYVEFAESGLMPSTDAYHRARVAVDTALGIDRFFADAHCMLAQLLMSCDYDWAGAERELKRAAELSPGSADVWDRYARLCLALGRNEDAITMQKRAHQLDPLAHRADLATTLMRAGRHAEALRAARRAVAFDPNYHRAHATLGWALFFMGRHAEGIAELQAAVALAPDQIAWLAQLGQAHALCGQTGIATGILERLETLAAERYVSPYHMAYIHTGLGDQERALDCLERACNERSGTVFGFAGSFLFTPLRPHPRFRALLKRMNLEEAWADTPDALTEGFR